MTMATKKNATASKTRAPRNPARKKTPAGTQTVQKISPAGTQDPAAAGAVTGLRVRMYRVGFGDFFLLTVPTGAGPAHIPIDVGRHAGGNRTSSKAVGPMGAATKAN